MSMKYLGESFDIHGGGLENQFPHHECEIAQSEGATGKPFVKYWLHNNMVTVNSQKMGKSLGNFVTLKQAFERWAPPVIRLFILQSHYRSPLDFSDGAIEAAGTGFGRLGNTLRGLKNALKQDKTTTSAESFDSAPFRKQFLNAMDDDFNTPQAVAVLFDMSREINSRLAHPDGMNRKDIEAALHLFDELGGNILGLQLEQQSTQHGLEDELMTVILDIRKNLRQQKLWGMTDSIRDSLLKVGIAIEDKKDGASWKRNTASS
jgi:cysteinyl-tRNA synthetase